MLSRATLVGWLLLGLTGIGSAELPNIVLVMADDQGWGDMAYHGHPVLSTPHFDEAASRGLSFDRFYAAAPVCSPTRASVITGRHPNRSGVFKWGHPLRPQEVSLPTLIGKAGYRTAHFGKWHLGSVRATSTVHPGRHGFDHWLSAPNFFDNDPVLSEMGRAVPFQGESSLVIVDAAIEWMRGRVDAEQAFLAVVWFGSPHSPHRGDDRFRRQYAGREDVDFLAEITAMDAAFGKLRSSLTDLGVRDNTIVWYCSDNGALSSFGAAGGFRGHKANVYDGGLLVPAIFEWPARISKPRSTMLRCNTSDILPTLCEIVGVCLPNRPYDGVSLVPLIENQMTAREKPMGFWDGRQKGIRVPAAEWMAELLEAQNRGVDLPPYDECRVAADLPDPSYSTESFPGHAAWIDGDWKLHRIENDVSDVRWEMYHLARDPYEQHDVVTLQPEKFTTLRSPFEAWLKSVVRSLNGQDYPAVATTP